MLRQGMKTFLNLAPPDNDARMPTASSQPLSHSTPALGSSITPTVTPTSGSSVPGAKTQNNRYLDAAPPLVKPFTPETSKPPSTGTKPLWNEILPSFPGVETDLFG